MEISRNLIAFYIKHWQVTFSYLRIYVGDVLNFRRTRNGIGYFLSSCQITEIKFMEDIYKCGRYDESSMWFSVKSDIWSVRFSCTHTKKLYKNDFAKKNLVHSATGKSDIPPKASIICVKIRFTVSTHNGRLVLNGYSIKRIAIWGSPPNWYYLIKVVIQAIR